MEVNKTKMCNNDDDNNNVEDDDDNEEDKHQVPCACLADS